MIKKPNKKEIPQGIIDKPTIDAFSNVLARLGYGTNNLSEGTSYPLTRLTRNYILMQSLYRTNWIARKVIDAKPEDMLKNGIKLMCEAIPEDIDIFDKTIKKTATIHKILTGVKWGRLFGGAGAVIIIAGHENILKEPLNIDDINPGSYKGLLVFDRWSGISPSAEINTDINNPIEFGLPKYYRVTTEKGIVFDVHSSRVLRFVGRDLPMWEKQAEMRWGISEFELIYQELTKRDNTSFNIASLVFRANVLGLKMDDLSQMLSGIGSNQNALIKFNSILSQQNSLMSNQGMLILPKDGGIEQHTYSFGGINDVYMSFEMDIAAAAGYPFSRLFGRTITGLGQSNEGDEQIYYDNCDQERNREIRPQLEKLIPIIAMSAWGEIPDDLDFEFKAIRTMTPEERAELADKKSRSIVQFFNAGIIGRKTALKEMKEMSEETGMFTNITDEMIEAADDDVNEGEEPKINISDFKNKAFYSDFKEEQYPRAG